MSQPSSATSMTTTDASARPGSEDGSKKLAEAGGNPQNPAETPAPKIPPASLTSASAARRSSSSVLQEAPDEPMETEAGHFGFNDANDANEHQGKRTLAGAVGGVVSESESPTTTPKATDVGRTSELSLEELSISSRQQLASSAALAASSGSKVTEVDPAATLRRPNRKRKLLEDAESGKTLLLDAYKVWQQGQKVMTYDLARVEKIMSETYMLIKQVSTAVEGGEYMMVYKPRSGY